MDNFNPQFFQPNYNANQTQFATFSNSTNIGIVQNNMNNINNNNINQKQRTRYPFSFEEDQRLLELVKQYGTQDKYSWQIIALNLIGRNARQCRERYQLFLKKGIREKIKWTKEEDKLLLSKYALIGPHWKKMEKFFVGKNLYNIKNRFNSLTSTKKRKIQYYPTIKRYSSQPKIELSPSVNDIKNDENTISTIKNANEEPNKIDYVDEKTDDQEIKNK